MTFTHVVVFCLIISSRNYLFPSYYGINGSLHLHDSSEKCLPNQFHCKEGCISKDLVCDKVPNCKDGEDEKICNGTCQAGFTQCSDGKCISIYDLCDGFPDCFDHGDESYCSGNILHCGVDFACPGSSMCIKGSFVCDGEEDCPHGEDEFGCNGDFPCDRNEFMCDNGHCIALFQRCDGISNCDDHSDENYCSSKNKTHSDKCSSDSVCSQVCINGSDGKATCTCLDGYRKDPNNTNSCLSTMGHGSLLYTQKEVIFKFNLDDEKLITLCYSTSAISLDYDFDEKLIFWNDNKEKKIYKSAVDYKSICSKKVVLSKNLTSVDGIAIDWIYKHIYWTDNEKNTVELANYDGSMRKTIIKDDLDEPRALAVHPNEGLLFWSDWGKHSCIERSWLDGSHRKKIIKYGVEWPNGLTLDFVKRKLYWVDGKMNSISSSNYDGSDQTMIIRSYEILKHPFSISVFEDFMYWTDLETNSAFKANKFNGKNVTTVLKEMHQPATVVQLWHPSRQRAGENYCSGNNCSHLCFPTQEPTNESSFICACPDGLSLSDNQLDCFHHEHKKEIVETTSEINNNNTKTITIALSIVLLVIVTLLVGFILRKYYKKKKESANYNNPVYQQTTEEKKAKPLETFQSTYTQGSEEVTINLVKDN
ncbi:very low-density lipoprotein receptor-like [Cimex lectularius]|uniref:Very low-density lipoprotein receptor n=1 Tax=Cimex lectularius TaxID=79782 RepID=A0A8I6RH92_CIMLE|nr:very low-density lipoprotein receptor-like [Cimex lectularius]